MTKLTDATGDACSTQGSYHAEVTAAGNNVPYVFIDENCNGARSVLDAATASASHEIAETVTNPHPFFGPALIGFDPAHSAWGLASGHYKEDDEIGDICEGFADAFFMGPKDLPYSLQRLWSNANAAAGHSPCAPQSTEPYFNVSPAAMETLNVFFGVGQPPKAALGYEIPVGSSKTFAVGYYSDAPTGYWNINAVEGNGITAASTQHLSFAVSNGTGLNGKKSDVTVTVNSAADAGNAILMTMVSTAPGHTTHYMPILIGAY
jgi:hypothetical protein